MKAWFRFFRAVNLVSVPGDSLVGAAACGLLTRGNWHDAALVALASVLMYMFGLADNDIVGAATDRNRPLVTGELSLRAAKIARAFALTLAAIAYALGHGRFPLLVALVSAIIVYNRTKIPLVMGLCRGLNVLLGGLAWVPAAVWTVYITAVTKYSEREAVDPKNDFRVQLLVRFLVVLQAAFLIYYMI